VAVVVNDMSEVNVDASLLESNQVSIRRGSDEMVELSNGCICCTLREDLLSELVRLATDKEHPVDYILVESTGISEPIPVAQTFLYEDLAGRSLSRVARLDTMVTVVDTSSFLDNLGTIERLAERKMQATETDARTISALMVDQVEFATVIVLNKVDLVSPETLERVRRTVTALNPSAKLVYASFSAVDPIELLNTESFSMDEASQAPGWLAELRGQHVPETEEYGIRSFVYSRNQPFDAGKLAALLADSGSDNAVLFGQCNAVRSKGVCWVAQDPRIVVEWSSAGSQLVVGGVRLWAAAVATVGGGTVAAAHDHEHGHRDGHGQADAAADSCASASDEGDEPGEEVRAHDQARGAPKTELVFIGVDLDQETIVAKLDACLADAHVAADPAALYTQPPPFLAAIGRILVAHGLVNSEQVPGPVAGRVAAETTRLAHQQLVAAQAQPVATASEDSRSAVGEASHAPSVPPTAPAADQEHADRADLETQLDTVRAALIDLHDADDMGTSELEKMAELSDRYAELMIKLGLAKGEEAERLVEHAASVKQAVAEAKEAEQASD